jgi:hypothetical protein
MTVGLPGDAWITGGWIGLILVVAVAGFALGRAHRWFWKNAQNPMALLFYASGLAMMPQLFRDGGVVSIAKFLLYAWTPLLAWLGINWLIGPRLVAYSRTVLARGDSLRLASDRLLTRLWCIQLIESESRRATCGTMSNPGSARLIINADDLGLSRGSTTQFSTCCRTEPSAQPASLPTALRSRMPHGECGCFPKRPLGRI